MIRVAALTPGRHIPSARFRVRQYLPDLLEQGIEVTEWVPRIDKYARLPGWPRDLSQLYMAPAFVAWQGAKLATRAAGIASSWSYQITWLQRDLLPGIPTLEGLLGDPLVFDVDDAVWLKKPWGAATARRIARRARVVVAGNQYVAEWFEPFASDVRVVPTAIDSKRFVPANKKEDDRFHIGWTGTASNFHYLRSVVEPLRRFLMDHPTARFVIMAENRPRLDLPEDQVQFLPWSAATEVAAVQALDVGLMPLADDAWAHGKCSFKMLQYMACGVPAVVSPIGTNQQLLSMGDLGIAAEKPDDWYQALEHLYQNRSRGRDLGQVGRQVVEEHFDRRLVAQQLGTILRDVATNPSRRRVHAPRQHFEEEVRAGERFEFGKNWTHFLSVLDDERIEIAQQSLRDMLELESLDGLTFLDVGSGSGLFSLVARRLGARVHSFDFDPQAVACTQELRRRFFPEDPEWTIEGGSVLDLDYLAALGTFDIVYSWGVLHHTGDMWRALANVRQMVAPKGALFVGIYNDRGLRSRYWQRLKRLYCSGLVGRYLVCSIYVPYYFVGRVVKSVLTGRNQFRAYRKNRGMSAYFDWFDWLGGYPYEVARVEELFRFFRDSGFEVKNLKTVDGLGINELVMVRQPDGG